MRCTAENRLLLKGKVKDHMQEESYFHGLTGWTVIRRERQNNETIQVFTSVTSIEVDAQEEIPSNRHDVVKWTWQL